MFVCLFDLILYVPSTIFQLYRDGSSWVEPVLSYDKCVLLKDHNAVTPVRLEPAALWSRVKHCTSEPLRSLFRFLSQPLCFHVESMLEAKALTRLLHMLPDPHPSPIDVLSINILCPAWTDPESFVRGGPTQTRLFFCLF